MFKYHAKPLCNGGNMEVRFIRITVTIPKPLLKEIDRACKTYGYTRSELIREAARRFLAELYKGE